VISINTDSPLNSILPSIRKSLSGIKLASIYCLYSKNMMEMLHSGLDFSRIRTKINISMLIGLNGSIKMKRKRMDKRDLEESIPHKCKVFIFLSRLRRNGRHGRHGWNGRNGRIPRYGRHGRNGRIPRYGWNGRHDVRHVRNG
jgi:hypothetical protein